MLVREDKLPQLTSPGRPFDASHVIHVIVGCRLAGLTSFCARYYPSDASYKVFSCVFVWIKKSSKRTYHCINIDKRLGCEDSRHAAIS